SPTIILFGSFSRWDWHKTSDIDLFIYGDDSQFEKSKYESRLKHEIQIFNFKNKTELKKIPKELLQNIICGNILKGNLNFLEVKING
ncbi:MAG: nucleotidyltransferase domain-containing protein, partial [Candidatus Nanoarchaeia archaeon]|nr:nucleotidyltransferase domain-containing protein [Candidatus Nanoarchaeia archaeon]